MTTPYYFSAFKPFGYQREVLDIVHNYNYSDKFYPELLLSGSVGSAKSSLLAHIAISHCLRWKKARVAISRLALPELKRTLFKEILDALENDPAFVEGRHYRVRRNSADITFCNGSEIMSLTYGDKNYGKSKSFLFSLVLIEEATEFDDEFYEGENSGFDILRGRINRLSHVKENLLILATNPDEPSHYLHKYFIEGEKQHANRMVFYSQTDKNPYLDPKYIEQLKASYSPLMAERYLRGKWISLAGKGIYAAYDPNVNKIDEHYKIREDLPIRISWDFNISLNKPMSCVLSQYHPETDSFHFYNEAVIDGSYTLDICEDLFERGLLDHPHIIIHGDATGRARHTASKLGNYQIITSFLEQNRISYEMKVPKANPPIRKRHMLVNSYCKNDLGEVRLFVYKNAPTAHQGLLTTQLKKGANFVEDDTSRSQHISTAIGYCIYSTLRNLNRKSGVRKK